MRIFILLIVFISLGVKAQIDSAITVPLVGINFGGQLPMFDLSKRFGPNLRAGGSFLLKTKKNWVYGIECNYLFGKNVKEDVLTQLKTPEGFVTDNEGFPGDLRVTERGMTLHVIGGRVFKLASANPNSGLLVCVGVGALQHKINLYDGQRKIAAIKGDLVHGYDRLSAGVAFSQFIGYLFLSENRLLNFYFGFEFYQASTKSLRKLNYDTGLPDTQKRFDGLAGFRAGWILPLYKKTPNDFYYN
jgi:hypothetical protein